MSYSLHRLLASVFWYFEDEAGSVFEGPGSLCLCSAGSTRVLLRLSLQTLRGPESLGSAPSCSQLRQESQLGAAGERLCAPPLPVNSLWFDQGLQMLLRKHLCPLRLTSGWFSTHGLSASDPGAAVAHGCPESRTWCSCWQWQHGHHDLCHPVPKHVPSVIFVGPTVSCSLDTWTWSRSC